MRVSPTCAQIANGGANMLRRQDSAPSCLWPFCTGWKIDRPTTLALALSLNKHLQQLVQILVQIVSTYSKFITEWLAKPVHIYTENSKRLLRRLFSDYQSTVQENMHKKEYPFATQACGVEVWKNPHTVYQRKPEHWMLAIIYLTNLSLSYAYIHTHMYTYSIL